MSRFTDHLAATAVTFGLTVLALLTVNLEKAAPLFFLLAVAETHILLLTFVFRSSGRMP